MRIFSILFRVFFPRPVKKSNPTRPNLYDFSAPAVEIRHPAPATAGPNRVIHGITIVRHLRGRCWVVDGDTITIGNTNIRLAGIDAPELDQPYGNTAKWALYNLCKGKVITAEFEDHLTYDRRVATCYLPDGSDLSAEMVTLGMALDWRKFSGGKYRHLEPQDARRKLWRVEAKHHGKMPPSIPN